MQLSIKNKKIVAEFQYDSMIHALILTVPTRTFDKKNKYWTFDMHVIVPVVKLLVPIGFKYTEDVVNAYKQAKASLVKLEKIKAGELTELQNIWLDNLNMPLYEYQRQGAAFLTAAKSALLCDQPGLGKTLQTIATIVLSQSKKTLVFCPKSVKHGWYEECAKWAPSLRVTVVEGTKKQRNQLWNSDSDVYVANYALLLHDFDVINKVQWDLCACDEATVIANGDAKTTKQLKKLKISRRIAMTGTPLSNKVEDIWSLVDWVQPGKLGSYFWFESTYCTKNRWGAVDGYKNLKQLSLFVDDVMIRRLKKDVLTQLPPKITEKRYVELSDKEREIYELISKNIVKELKEQGLPVKQLKKKYVKDIRLRQVANAVELISPVKYPSSKLAELKKLVKELIANEEKVLIFTQFREMAELIAVELSEYLPLQITGAVDEDQRTANRHLFNESTTHNVMILTSAGNMGLNLQSASSVIHYDLPWSIAQLQQREDRAHRNGQTKTVTVYMLIAEDTIDELMHAKLMSKLELSDKLLKEETEDTIEIPEDLIDMYVQISDNML